jgi:all-trans-retinol 13,14-reductase
LKSEVSLSAIKAFIGLKGTPSEIGFEKNDYVVVGSYDLDSEFDRFIAEDFAGSPFMMSNNTVINPGDTPEGRSIIQWGTVADGKSWCRLPKETYKNKKVDLTEVIIKRISEVIPDIRDRIEVIEVGTPHTMERYTLNPNGAVSGYALTSNQRPNLNPRTPVTGLFLAGAWTFPGPGFGGTTMSGANTARIILGK